MKFNSLKSLIFPLTLAGISVVAAALLAVSRNDSIRVKMHGVDDIGYVVIINEIEKRTVLQCEWRGGNEGAASKNIEDELTTGENYILFILYNKIYDGGFLFKGGKWSFQFSLDKNGRTVWTDSDFERDNTKGIKYWKAIRADVSPTGAISITTEVEGDVKRKIAASMEDVEEQLNKSAGTATPFGR